MRILIGDNDPVCRRALRAALTKWGYDVLAVRDGVEAWQVLQQKDAPRLVILDWMIPGMDGAQVCRKVRKGIEQPYVYMLLLTANDHKQDIEGMEAGADDCLAKPLDMHKLQARLRAGKRILDLQEKLISAREAVQAQATHDSLTGLWNRAAILELLQREMARARREGTPIGVIMADLDHFKQINDTYGHPTGDAVLYEVACRLQSSVRHYDAISRCGGEEFLIVAPGCDRENAAILAKRLRRCIGGKAIAIGGEAISVTISLGVAASDRKKEWDINALIRDADTALYQAKSRGRDSVELYTTAEATEAHP